MNRSHPAIREHELPGADLRWVLPAPPRRLPGLHRLLSEIERVLFLVVSVLNDAVLGLNPLSVTLKSSRRIPLPLTYILETSIRIRVHNLIHSLSLVQSLKVFWQRWDLWSWSFAPISIGTLRLIPLVFSSTALRQVPNRVDPPSLPKHIIEPQQIYRPWEHLKLILILAKLLCLLCLDTRWFILAGVRRANIADSAREPSFELSDYVGFQFVVAILRLSLSILNFPKTVDQIDQLLVVVLRLKDVYDILQL